MLGISRPRASVEGTKFEGGHVLSHIQLKNLGQPKQLQIGLGDNHNPLWHTPHFARPSVDTKASSSSLALPSRNRGFKHLMRTEIEEQRRKGLCFKCGQTFSPQHRCPKGQFHILLLSDDEEVDDDDNIVPLCKDSDIGKHEDEEECRILDFLGLPEQPNPSSQTLKL